MHNLYDLNREVEEAKRVLGEVFRAVATEQSKLSSVYQLKQILKELHAERQELTDKAQEYRLLYQTECGNIYRLDKRIAAVETAIEALK